MCAKRRDTVEGFEGEGKKYNEDATQESALHAPTSNSGVEDAPGPRQGELEFPRLEAALESSDYQDESELLDAWYATYASPMTRAIAVREKSLEVVIGTDERRQITGNVIGNFPWRAICSLVITAGNGTRWVGTGWFASPRLVVTAGHCVHMRDQGGWVRSIEVIPGRDGSSAPFGRHTSTSFRSVAGWTQRNDRNADYGAIVLGTNVGTQTGYFTFASRPDNELRTYVVNVSGYPSDKSPGTQWWDAKPIEQVNATTISYKVDTVGGQSGAPTWVMFNNARTVVGIHTNGSSSFNSATRITQEVLNNIVNWR